MLNEIAIAACLAMSPGQCATCGPGGGGMEFSPGSSSGSWTAGAGGGGNPYDAVGSGGGGGGDQLYPFDSPEPWLHGWFQEIPAYGGYHTFRPHNYKHVIAQMEVAGRWGMSPVMPYSHQWYHPFRQRAGMHPDFGHQQASHEINHPGMLMSSGNGNNTVPAQPANIVANDRPADVQTVGAFNRGYHGTPIPGIATPYYQVPTVPQTYAPQQEYLDRLEQLQKQIEQQTFQMQVMQEQLRNQPANLQPWQMPNHAQFGESQLPPGYQPQPGYPVHQGYAPQGYQESPLPPTGGPALQPGYPANVNFGVPGTGIQGNGYNYSPVPSNGINLLANPNLPYGAAPQLAPGSFGNPVNMMMPSNPPMSGYQPGGNSMPAGSNSAPMLGPMSMSPNGGVYRASDNAAAYGQQNLGYPNSNGGTAHANYAYPNNQQPPQNNMNLNWSGSNYGNPTNFGGAQGYAAPQGYGTSPNNVSQQSYYPNSVPNGGNSAVPQNGSTPNSNFSSGFRPFGRFLR